LGLGDYLPIVELILGINGEWLGKGVGIALADSVLATPQASFGGIEFYPELKRKAAVLPEHSIKNHPSPGSNKRGLHREWMFITINGRTWTLEDPDEIVPMITRVASGEISTEEFTERVALNIEE
jgi:prophage maintenance system killer protein